MPEFFFSLDELYFHAFLYRLRSHRFCPRLLQVHMFQFDERYVYAILSFNIYCTCVCSHVPRRRRDASTTLNWLTQSSFEYSTHNSNIPHTSSAPTHATRIIHKNGANHVRRATRSVLVVSSCDDYVSAEICYASFTHQAERTRADITRAYSLQRW